MSGLGRVGLGSCRDCGASRESDGDRGSGVDATRGDRSSVRRRYRPIHSRVGVVRDRCRKSRGLRWPGTACESTREHSRSGGTYADTYRRWVAAASAGKQKAEERERDREACNRGVPGQFPSGEANHDNAREWQCQREPRRTMVSALARRPRWAVRTGGFDREGDGFG